MQSLPPIIMDVVSSIPDRHEVYSIQTFVIMFFIGGRSVVVDSFSNEN